MACYFSILACAGASSAVSRGVVWPVWFQVQRRCVTGSGLSAEEKRNNKAICVNFQQNTKYDIKPYTV